MYTHGDVVDAGDTPVAPFSVGTKGAFLLWRFKTSPCDYNQPAIILVLVRPADFLYGRR